MVSGKPVHVDAAGTGTKQQSKALSVSVRQSLCFTTTRALLDTGSDSVFGPTTRVVVVRGQEAAGAHVKGMHRCM